MGWVFGTAMTQWPYPHACGVGFGSYLAAVVAMMIVAVWCSTLTWKNRLVGAHIVSLALLGWGSAMGTAQVLPHMGDASLQAAFVCTAAPPAAPAPVETAAPAAAPEIEPSQD